MTYSSSDSVYMYMVVSKALKILFLAWLVRCQSYFTFTCLLMEHENLFTLEEFENLFIHVHIVIDKQYTYPWPLKIKLSIFT